MGILFSLEPILRVEAFGLGLVSKWSCSEHDELYLSHVFEEFLTTPARQVPVIIVLLCASNAKRPVNTRATTQELATGELDLAPVHTPLWRSDKIPVCLGIEVLAPA